MYIEFQHGLKIIYNNQNKNENWGIIDKEGNYITDRTFSKGQIFYHFKNAMAIQLDVLELLEKHYFEGKIKISVYGFEKEPFTAIMPVKDFRRLAVEEFGDKSIYCYDKPGYRYGKQIRLPMHCFVKEYRNQSKLV